MRPSPLPVDAFLPDILLGLEKSNALVLQATPGAGKTTRVPPALLQASWLKRGSEIVVLEPRRLAAKMAARRVASEMGEDVGRTVGYQFRFENVTSKHTRIRFLTEGLFIRRLISDPSLSSVGAVILDEFHERHLQGDLALAIARRLQQSSRPDLRILVMSATLDTESVASYLGGAGTVTVETRQFPVEIRYLDHPAAGRRRWIEPEVTRAVSAALDALDASEAPRPTDAKRSPSGESDRDVLVFLPGMADIRRCADALASLAERRDLLIAPLHGQLSRSEQDLAVNPSRRGKIILATNVAETSLTIPGVAAVIDSGLAKTASHSWWSGLPALHTRSISKASATQRAGRAGRTGPGLCYRLYTRHEYETRPPFEVPEIRRSDLAQTVLELKALGVGDLTSFPWFEVPSVEALESAEKLLIRLGALNGASDGRPLTELGRKLAALPVHPRIGRLVYEAALRGVRNEGAFLAAAISEMRIEPGPSLDVLDAVERERRLGRSPVSVRKMAERLEKQVEGEGVAAAKGIPGANDRIRALRHCVLAAFPDRVARLREDGSELVFCGGGSASVPTHAHLEPGGYSVVADAEETRRSSAQGRGQTVVRALSPIEPEWLFDLEPSGVTENDELIWDSARLKVESRSRILYDQLVLDESRSKPSDPEAATRLLIESVLGNKGPGVSALCSPSELESLNHRLLLLGVNGFDEAKPFTPESLIQVLSEACAGMISAAEIRQLGVIPLLVQSLPAGIRDRLNRLVPTEIALPGRRRVPVHYESDKTPWIESRMQDFFGLTQGPAVVDGRVPLTLHLLAPNRRAVQVTTDLAGFWKNHYPQLRKELGRRYPRHRWPEDPVKGRE